MGAEVRGCRGIPCPGARVDCAPVWPVVVLSTPIEEFGASGFDDSTEPGFRVRLRNFEGPFDLLLSLINQHRLDVTEVALHQVTDDFIAYTKSLGHEMG